MHFTKLQAINCRSFDIQCTDEVNLIGSILSKQQTAGLSLVRGRWQQLLFSTLCYWHFLWIAIATVFCHNWQHSLNTPVKHLSFSSKYYFIHILNSYRYYTIYSVHIPKRTNRWNALKVENFFSCFCRETTTKFLEGFCVSSEDVLLETWQMKLMAVNSYKLIQPFRLFWHREA